MAFESGKIVRPEIAPTEGRRILSQSRDAYDSHHERAIK